MRTSFVWAGRIATGLATVSAVAVLGLPAADAACEQTVGQSIDSYLGSHPDVKRHLASQSQAEGGGTDVIGYLNRHPDVRQHLIDLSQRCTG